MRSAYLITRGSYSDYRVLAVCETKERADAEVAIYNRIQKSAYADIAEVSECPFISADDPVVAHHTTYRCEMYVSGSMLESSKTSHAFSGNEPPARPSVTASRDGEMVIVDANSAEAARKAAADHIAYLRARKEGVA